MNLQMIVKFFCEVRINFPNYNTKSNIKKFLDLSWEIEKHVDMVKNSCKYLQEFDFILTTGEEKNFKNMFDHFILVLAKFNNHFIPRDSVCKISNIFMTNIKWKEIYERIHLFNIALKKHNEDMKDNLEQIKKIDLNRIENKDTFESIKLIKKFTFFCTKKIDELLEINNSLINFCHSETNTKY